MSETESQPKEKISLSDEFQKEIKNRERTPWVGVTVVSILGLIVFISLGIGTYQIFFKPDQIKQADTEKIESRPQSTEQKTPTITTPAAPATQAPATTAPAAATPETYTVQSGDTLSGIAAKYNTTSKAIADYNGIADPESVLSIGQTLKIPK